MIKSTGLTRMAVQTSGIESTCRFTAPLVQGKTFLISVLAAPEFPQLVGKYPTSVFQKRKGGKRGKILWRRTRLRIITCNRCCEQVMPGRIKPKSAKVKWAVPLQLQSHEHRVWMVCVNCRTGAWHSAAAHIKEYIAMSCASKP